MDQPESLPQGPARAKYLPQIALACKRLAGMVERALAKQMMPLVLGGDHSVAVGTLAGVSHYFRLACCIDWAHLNWPTSWAMRPSLARV